MWVFRIPKAHSRRNGDSEEDDLDTEAQIEAMIERMEIEERERAGEKMALLEVKLRGQEDMNGVCGVLRDAGAVFYEDLRECPEVVDWGLLEPVEPETGRNDWVPPDGLRGRPKWRDSV